MSEYKDEIYLLIILFLVILAASGPVINAEIHSKEECETLIKRGCVSIENLAKYQGCSDELIGWEIERTVKFGTPKPLEDFGLKRAPQSWCYTEVVV